MQAFTNRQVMHFMKQRQYQFVLRPTPFFRLFFRGGANKLSQASVVDGVNLHFKCKDGTFHASLGRGVFFGRKAGGKGVIRGISFRPQRRSRGFRPALSFRDFVSVALPSRRLSTLFSKAGFRIIISTTIYFCSICVVFLFLLSSVLFFSCGTLLGTYLRILSVALVVGALGRVFS